MSSKERPTLGGTRIKTRKRNIAAPLDPAAFADAVVQIYLDNAGDLELVAKIIESSDLNFSRYGDTFFEVVFIGGRTQPGTIKPDEGERHPCAVLGCEPTREAILPSVLYIQKILRRRPFLIKNLENVMRRFLQSLELFEENERKKLAIFTALTFSQKLSGLPPETVFQPLLKGNLVAKGLVLLFMTDFFKEYLTDNSLDDLISLLKRGKMEDNLLEFFPSAKRSAESFSEHFTKEGLVALVEYNEKKIFDVKLKEMKSALTTQISEEVDISEVIETVKQRVRDANLPDIEVVRILWDVIMDAVQWSGKNQQQNANAALRQMAQVKKGTPNFRWSTSYSEFAIKYIADLAKEGLKVDNAFKNTAYMRTAEAVNAKFKINEVDVKKVMSHYKTIKSWWETIQNAKNLSGNGNYFDEDTYAIGMDADTAREYIAAHPKAEKWINRPIPLYNEMQIICGNDRAIGKYITTSSRPLGTSQPISDGAIELDTEDIFDDSAPLDGHEVPDPTPTPSPSPSVTSRGNKPSKSKKRVHDEEEISVAENLKDISRGFNRYADLLETSMAVRFEHLDQKKIYAEVFALEEKGYSEDELYDIYVHLIKEEKDARIFIGAQERIRLKRVDEFLNGRRSGYRPTAAFPFNDSVM